MIVLDVNVLIGHLEIADEHHGRATELLQTHRGEVFGASVVTLAEIFAGAARAGRVDAADRILDQRQIRAIELDHGAARRLGELRALTRLKMPDCCVIHAAEQHNAAIATFDAQLAVAAERVGAAIVAH